VEGFGEDSVIVEVVAAGIGEIEATVVGAVVGIAVAGVDVVAMETRGSGFLSPSWDDW